MKTLCCLFAILLIVPVASAQDMPLSDFLIPGEGWKKVEGKFKAIRYLTSYGPETIDVWDMQSKLQAILNLKDMSISTQFKETKLSYDRFTWKEDITLVLDRKKKAILFDRGILEPEIVKENKLPLDEPSAMWLCYDDRGTAFLGDAGSKYIWAFRVTQEGLSGGERYMTLRLKKGDTRSEITDIRDDPAGRIFAVTKEGIQVFDPTGRLCGVLSNPGKERPMSIVFCGKRMDLLFAACGNEIYFRKMQAQWIDKSANKK